MGNRMALFLSTAILLSCLCIATIGTGFAFSQVGVFLGETFYYGVSGFGSPQPMLAELVNRTEYMKVTITSINASRVVTENVLYFNDDTESILQIEYDLDSGDVNFLDGSFDEGLLFV